MRLLVLGGGVFLGAAVVSTALARGHDITVFNRGRSRSAWPAAVEVMTGDRSSDLTRTVNAAGRRWDAVIDTCGYVPNELRVSAAALKDCGRYLFVSSISAYAGFRCWPVEEGAPLASAADLDPDDRDPRHYGAQKAACEAEVFSILGERGLVVRPGLIVGPGDPTGRFSHWPWRVADGGEVLVPAIDGATPLQFIDVRDLAEWMLHLLEQNEGGAFNATGPTTGQPGDWGALLSACADVAAQRDSPAADFVRVDEAFLVDEGVQPWSQLPLWIPSTEIDMVGFMRIGLQRAEAHGLRTRPLRDTVAAVLDDGMPAPEDKRRAGKLGRERERELIARWRATREKPVERGRPID
jgi:2'-hydroxyisoflavone reductase